MPKYFIANKLIATLRKRALSLPGAEEATSCKKAAFKAGKKNFFFLGEYGDSWDAMLKLADSLPVAEKLAKGDPDTYGVGGHGWVTAKFALGKGPPAGVFERWTAESYLLLVPKKISTQLG